MSYQPQPQQAQPAQPANGMAIASMVLGIVGLVFSFVPIIGVIAWPLVILGVVFGGIALNQANRVPGSPTGMAIAGLTCSIIGLVICFIWAIAAS
ncbi:DUF4190 domain-containing protein [Actinophytocola sp.]|uniref:DUF4190 domain-containing protein n=1 Tax=Actinophytocola sp. TaxID=1872138 RepID=UPI003D6C1A9D